MCVCGVLYEVEGGSGEFKTLGLTEDGHELPCAQESEQIKAAYKRYIKHHKACIDSDLNVIIEETNTVNYFNRFHVSGYRKAGTFWFTCSCVKSYSLTTMRIDVSECKLLRKLIMSTTKKHVADKSNMLESHEYKASREEMCDGYDPKDLVDKVASCTLCFDLRRHSEPP